MRQKLAEMGSEKRHRFTGVFERFGKAAGFRGHEKDTVLLLDIRNEDGEEVCDHIWLNRTDGFFRLLLKQGDVVSFEGRVTPYERGYNGYREGVYVPYSIDYKISYPTKIKKVNRED